MNVNNYNSTIFHQENTENNILTEPLKKEISELKSTIFNMDNRSFNTKELNDLMSKLEKETETNSPNPNIINNCLEAISNIIQGAAGNAAFNIIQRIAALF